MPGKKINKNSTRINRRQFMKNLSCSLIGVKLTSENLHPLLKANKKEDYENSGKMKYHILGRTGLKISEIALGGHYDGMGWREKGSDKQERRNEVINESYKLGINFIDSNEVDESKKNGIALSTFGIKREKIYLSADTNAYKNEENYSNKTKMMDEIFKEMDSHLEALKTSYVDIFRLTHVTLPFNKQGTKNGLEAFKVLKKEGKARFFAISNHNPQDLFKIIDEIPEVDVIYVPYSYVTNVAEKVFPIAKKKDIGVICIKPFVKGTFFKLHDIDLKKLSENIYALLKDSDKTPEDLIKNTKQSLAIANLKYLLNNKNITTIIPGMETMQEARENVRASFEGEITKNEMGLLRDFWDNPHGEALINEMFSGKYHFLKHWRC